MPKEVPDVPARPGTFRRIVQIFKPYRRKVTFVAFLILVTSGLGLINPLLIKSAFETLLGDGPVEERLNTLYWIVG